MTPIEVKRVAWPPPNPKSAIETKVETEMENTKLIPDGTIFASSEESNQEVSFIFFVLTNCSCYIPKTVLKRVRLSQHCSIVRPLRYGSYHRII